MKPTFQLLTLSALLCSCGGSQEAHLTQADRGLEQKVLGTWIYGDDKPGVGWSGGVTTLLQNRTFASRSTNRWAGGSKEFAYQGTWRVVEGVVVFTYTESSEPKDVPVGSSNRYEIVRLDEQELTTMDLSSGMTNLWVMRRSK